jgi:ribosomal protein L37AE/L43A
MIKENGVIVKCPKCGSTNVIRVHPFDYWKQCKDCKTVVDGKTYNYEFMTGVHN